MKTKKKAVQKIEWKKSAILYARVAVKNIDQKPSRLDLQLDKLMVYCQDRGIQIEQVYADYSSGSSFERYDFKSLLMDLKQGNIQADLLLFTSWDRFSRDLTSMKKMVKELEAYGIKPQAIKDKSGSEAILKTLRR